MRNALPTLDGACHVHAEMVRGSAGALARHWLVRSRCSRAACFKLSPRPTTVVRYNAPSTRAGGMTHFNQVVHGSPPLSVGRRRSGCSTQRYEIAAGTSEAMATASTPQALSAGQMERA